MAKAKSTKKRTSKGSTKRSNWLSSSKTRLLLVVAIFGLVGVAIFLYQTFAATNRADFWGALNAKNPTASYKLTTGAGDMSIAFSNNTADLQLNVTNSANKVVGTLQSIGKKDVFLTLKVVPDTYTISLKSTVAYKTKGPNKGYSIHVTYPTEDLVKPTAVILQPLNQSTLKGTVDFTVDAQDDVGVSKVEFYASGAKLDTDTTAPYGTKWDTTVMKDGVYQLEARSYDTTGNIGIASGEVTIKNAVPVASSRFPGDPNPKVNGKAYFGVSGTHAAALESATGKSVSLFRSYASSWPSQSKLVEAVKDAHVKNRLPWISVKTPGWGTLASGSRDGEIDSLLRAIDSAANGKPVWFTVHHEFEGDSTATGEYTPANFRAMQTKIRQRMTAVGTKNIAFMPIFQGHSWDNHDKWNKDDFWVPGIWDAVGVDHYSQSVDSNLLRERWYKFVAWVEERNMPFAIGEYGVRDYGNSAQSASELKAFWDWHFTNKKDMIGMSYFDSGLNSPDGTWELANDRLTMWKNISQNDTRVQRINELK
ncbi:MAG TPA: Ig-like domain-containing protein [Candidatus Saccharibacteria bacterium]|nr:Ig-like domain-containing protein [Candidatus Saccharibacteria bacterium]